MRPTPFAPVDHENGAPYVRDTVQGDIWHGCRLRTLYADTDRSQVVYHSNYLRYFEFGRASLMRDAAYTYKEVEASGYVYPIIEIGVKFYKSLFYDDAMVIYTRPAELERVRLRFEYIITHADTQEIACTGFTRHCAVNAKGTPVEVDPKTIQLWEVFPG